jgi:hypothetical protein
VLSLSAVTSVAALGPRQTAPSDASEHARLTLGILRRDGLLFPFASFDDGDWQAPWPDPSRVAALPIGLADIPRKWWGAAGPDARWTAWLTSGATGPLKLVAPVTASVFCSTRLAVNTDYRGGPYERDELTVPKDGLAIAGPASLLPIESVPPDSADAREIARVIADDFNREEKSASARFTNWRHPVAERVRRLVPIQIEALYRAQEHTKRDTWTTMYVEAVRMFPPGPNDDGCGLITFARAWVHQQAGAKPRIDLGARVTYCDREDVSFMLPFGRLLLRDEVYWVYQTSSWRDELYSVVRVNPKRVDPVVAVSGGLCFR